MRKPVNVTKSMSTREDLWKQIRALGIFTIPQLLETTSLDRTTVDLYVRSLVKAGRLKKEDVAESQAGKGVYATKYRYRLIRDALEAPRVRKDGSEVTQGRGRQNMWRSMRILKRFDLATIWAASGTEDHQVAREEIKTYILFLARAGYLKKTGEGEKAVYMLVRYTGPKAPMIQRIKQVYDQNLKAVVWPHPDQVPTGKKEENE